MGNGPMKSSKVGVDTGGTFTDFVWLDGRGRLHLRKQIGTPADPSEAIVRGFEGLELPAETAIVHGSTVATNALLERRGARTALVATAGFGDVLAIGRQDRPDLYALVPRKPEPLAPANWRFEVKERVTAEGKIDQALEADDLNRVVDKLLDEQVESVAVCLLFSFLRPEHERQIRAAIEARQTERDSGGRSVLVSLSSDILPEFREYERTSTTVINAYVAPLMSSYLARLEKKVAPRPLAVMQSNGGIIGAARAGREAARTVLSGPAGGVVGARYVAGMAGIDEIITFDMGGTSSDVALCPGELPATSEGEIAGLPMRLPIIDIHTVGAGGGSLASVDPGGALRVGPQSAGADPGPACYGRGGSEDGALELSGRTTTTDANLVLGRLDANHFLGGQMRLDQRAAREVMGRLGKTLDGSTTEEAAWGVVQVTNANMERAIRRISVERGHDPRRFTLVAFGGAGPLHACELAEAMQIPRVLVPAMPGVLSALGMLVGQPARDYSVTVMRRLDDDSEGAPAWLSQRYAEMLARAEDEMAAEGYGPELLAVDRRLDLRYVGQAYELTAPVSTDRSESEIAAAFHRAHGRRYGFERPDETVQVVNVRLTVEAQTRPPDLPRVASGTSDAQAAVIGSKRVWFGEGVLESVLYDRDKMQSGNRFEGPAIVFQYDTTTVVPPNWTAEVDEYGNLVLGSG
jgi:N-methylhydantoinase A